MTTESVQMEKSLEGIHQTLVVIANLMVLLLPATTHPEVVKAALESIKQLAPILPEQIHEHWQGGAIFTRPKQGDGK
jgi:hypothetical protein